MSDETARHIYDYVRMLRDSYGLYLTLHGCEPYVYGSMSINKGIIAEFNIHYCPYCFYVKGSMDKAPLCIRYQKFIKHKLMTDGEFFGMCHAGVCEFIFPVKYYDEVIGFVCVSGYRPEADSELYEKAMKRIEYTARRKGIDLAGLTELYDSALTCDIPDKRRLKVLISPLCDMLSLMIIERVGSQGIDREAGRSSTADELYLGVCRYIWEHHNEAIDLDMLCERFNYSRSYISHIFKRRSGQTLGGYINAMRIADAKTLLTMTDRRITEIAMDVGFGDSNYFTNVFRNLTGMSPKQWRTLHSADSKKHDDIDNR